MDLDVPRKHSRLSASAHDAAQLTMFGQNKDSMARILKAQNSVGSTTSSQSQLLPSDEKKPVVKKGSFTGVFIPTCENMWGVLIFLKFNEIVGGGGFMQALLAVLLSAIAAYATTVCLSAIASSGGILSEGGPYHMISRALGANFGATVGLVYWIGITFLAVMESKGAVHALELFDGLEHVHDGYLPTLIGSGLLLFCSLTVYGGVNLVTKMGSIFAGIVVLTLGLFYVGLFTVQSYEPSDNVSNISMKNFRNNWTVSNPVGFGITLGLFFPCFTGMLSGADRADVLADPAKNIRYGTFAALTLSLVMYLSFLFLWASVSDAAFLNQPVNQSKIVKRITEQLGSTWAPPAAYTGVILSCLAQVLQCLMVAPRLLQAIAKDGAIPILKWVAPVSKRNGEPSRALLVTTILGLILMFAIDNMDEVAKLVTICFLVCYAFLNATCVLLTVLRTTTWRPEGIFRRRWRLLYIGVGLTGLTSSLIIMIFVSGMWSLVVAIISIALYFYCDYAGAQTEWGSGLDGIKFNFALKMLQSLKDRQSKKINWRPQILVVYPALDSSSQQLTSSPPNKKAEPQPTTYGMSTIVEDQETPSSAEHGSVGKMASNTEKMLRFVGQLKKGKGMCVAASIVEAEHKTPELRCKMQEEKRTIERAMVTNEIFGFSEVMQAKSWGDGACQVIQLCGLGGLRPNTIVYSWPVDWRQDVRKASEFVRVTSFALGEEKAILCPKNIDAIPSEELKEGNIDLWWFIHDGGLLILLTWLLSEHKVWRNCNVRIFVVMEDVSTEEAHAAVVRLQKTLQRKNILPKGVHVEAVVLQEENMIAPYTYDWTIRAQQKKLQSQQSDLPLILDDLFKSDEEINAENPETRRSDSLWARLTGDSEEESPEPTSSKVGQETVDIVVPQYDTSPLRKHAAATHDEHHGHHVSGIPALKKLVSDEDLLGGVHAKLKNQRRVLDRKHTVQLASVGENEIPSLPSGPVATYSSFERLNKVILSKSSSSALVLMNLPDIWGTTDEDSQAFVAYCECLTAGLDRVVFAKSGGSEIFQLF